MADFARKTKIYSYWETIVIRFDITKNMRARIFFVSNFMTMHNKSVSSSLFGKGSDIARRHTTPITQNIKPAHQEKKKHLYTKLIAKKAAELSATRKHDCN